MMANKVHYPSLAALKNVEIVAISDLDAQKMKDTADCYGIVNRYQDYRSMLDQQRLDGVYVIMQPQYMYDIVRDCLSRRLHVFCEKPLGLTLHQAETLSRLARQAGVVTQVGHQRRSSPILNVLLNACKKGGSVNHAVCEFYKCDMSAMELAADHMHDDCSHSIDTLRWICGGEVVRVEARFKRINTPDINWVHATLEFDNGATGVLINSWASGRRVFRVSIHSPGACADVELENKAFLYENGDYAGVEYDCKQVVNSDEFYVYGGFVEKSREFVDSIESGACQVSSPFEDVVKTMRVLETIVAQSILTDGIGGYDR